jgi:hypothetical protein
MINKTKWINTLPRTKEISNQLDHDRWINTISKKKTYNSIEAYSVKAYSLTAILFVCGLIFVSIIKNETRSLQKEINNLEASINLIKFNLNQSILDNEVINSPENISLLANEYLNIDLVSYKKSQIIGLNENGDDLTQTNNLGTKIKEKVAKKIEAKKKEIKKLQDLYNKPETVPDEIKSQVALKIEEKKSQLMNLYKSPKEQITLERVGKWGVVQVVKAFLGMPMIPGR